MACEDCQAIMKVLLLKDPKEDEDGQDPYIRVSAWLLGPGTSAALQGSQQGPAGTGGVPQKKSAV